MQVVTTVAKLTANIAMHYEGLVASRRSHAACFFRGGTVKFMSSLWVVKKEVTSA